MIKFLKKVAKRYFELSAQTYVWLPTGQIPTTVNG